MWTLAGFGTLAAGACLLAPLVGSTRIHLPAVFDPSTLHALLSAVIAFVQYLADFTQTFRNVRWLMGSLDVASYAPIGAALVPMGVAWIGFATLPRVLDLISVGSESAAARGVNVERTE